MNKLKSKSADDPKPNLAIAVISLVFCIPIGAVAFVRAIQAYELLQPDNEVYWPSLALVYSKQSLRWSLLAIAVGICWWTLSIIIYFNWNYCKIRENSYSKNGIYDKSFRYFPNC
ncbi:hypothetical protein GJ496_000446 [Pomphorhynchus laevis]|nr:hypothetical protein GJ496_000446 [Pomphorhynchus laevis]